MPHKEVQPFLLHVSANCHNIQSNYFMDPIYLVELFKVSIQQLIWTYNDSNVGMCVCMIAFTLCQLSQFHPMNLCTMVWSYQWDECQPFMVPMVNTRSIPYLVSLSWAMFLVGHYNTFFRSVRRLDQWILRWSHLAIDANHDPVCEKRRFCIIHKLQSLKWIIASEHEGCNINNDGQKP